MNGFLVGDAGDVEKQKLFVEHPGDFIVAKHLPLEHRRSEAAADSYGDRAGEQVEGRTAHQIKELPSETPDGGLCGLGFRSLGHDDRGCFSHDRTLQAMRVPIIRRGLYEPWLHLVQSEDRTHSDTHDRIADAGPPNPTGDRVIDRRKGGQTRGILIHLHTSRTK